MQYFEARFTCPPHTLHTLSQRLQVKNPAHGALTNLHFQALHHNAVRSRSFRSST